MNITMKRKIHRALFGIPLFIILLSACQNPLTTKKPEKVAANYEVHHRREKIDGTFDEAEDEIVLLSGFVGEMTAAQPLTTSRYNGFVPQYVQQKIIRKEQTVKLEDLDRATEDEDNQTVVIRTVVIIEYYRVNYKFIFKDGDTVLKELKGRFEESVPEREIPAPEKDDVFFEGWNPATVPQTFTQNITFTAVWRSADTDYLVLHKKQNVSGDGYTTAEEEPKRAPANRLTAATAKTYTGFTAQPITQRTIAADGSTVVTVYYNRNNCTYSFNTNGGTTIEAVQGRYGAAVPAVQTPEKQGYTFTGWEPQLPQTFNDNIEYSAVWAPATDTQYKVEYYLQNLNLNGYTKEDQQIFNGTTNTTPTITARTYEGFEPNDFTPLPIQANGSTVVKIYYQRKSYTMTFMNQGQTYRTLTRYYGETFPSVGTPMRTGYDFNGWNPQLPETVNTVTQYTAQWIPKNDTPYRVDCYLQKVSRDGYTRVGVNTQNLTGTTGELTQASPLDLDGYVALENYEQQPIAADGSTVIIIYYDIAD